MFIKINIVCDNYFLGGLPQSHCSFLLQRILIVRTFELRALTPCRPSFVPVDRFSS